MQPTLTVTEFTTALMQPRFEAALRRRVGQGRDSARWELAETLGCDPRTVDGWLNDGRLPPLCLYFRLRAHFGPGFEREIFEGLDVEPSVPVDRAALKGVLVSARAVAESLEALADRKAEAKDEDRVVTIAAKRDGTTGP